MEMILYKTHALSQSVQANKCQFPFKTLFNFPDVSARYQLVTNASRFHKPAFPVCASSALLGACYVAFSLAGQGGAGEQGAVPPPKSCVRQGNRGSSLQEGSGLCQAAQKAAWCLQEFFGWQQLFH